MLLEAGANPDGQDADQRTPLFEAATASHMEIARLLVQAGADVNLKELCGFTALSRASRSSAVASKGAVARNRHGKGDKGFGMGVGCIGGCIGCTGVFCPDIQTDTDRHRHRQTDTGRHRQTQTDTDRPRQRDTDTENTDRDRHSALHIFGGGGGGWAGGGGGANRTWPLNDWGQGWHSFSEANPGSMIRRHLAFSCRQWSSGVGALARGCKC